LKSIAICVLAGVLGALPGVVLTLAAQDSSFLGIALIGGLIGLALGATPIFYRTTISDAIRRVAKGFTRTLIQYNVGDLLSVVNIKTGGITAGEPKAMDLTRSSPAPNDDRAISKATIGGIIGAAGGALATFVAGVIWWDYFSDEKDPVKRGFHLFFSVMIAAVVAGIYGSAIGMLAVPGRHRLRIVAAASFGFLLGLGMRLAVGPPKGEWGTAFFILVPVTVCTAAGVFAPENF